MVVPVQRDDDVPWIYNDSAFKVSTGQTQISFAVARSDHDVRICLRVNGLMLNEPNSMGIQDLKVHNDKRHEWLEMTISHGSHFGCGPHRRSQSARASTVLLRSLSAL